MAYLLFANALSACAEAWMITGRNSEDHVISVDMSNMEVGGDSVTYWKKINFAQRRENGDLSYKVRETMNCKRKESVIRYMMTYDDVDFNGQLTSKFANRNPSWQPVEANSLHERTMNHVCDENLRKLFAVK